MIKEFFTQEHKNIFDCFAKEKLDENNFEYFYYHKISSNFDFNRGFYAEQNGEWIIGLEVICNQNNIFIYSNSKNRHFLDNIFDFVNVKSSFHSIMGSHSIVSHILKKYSNNFESFMDRVFYELNREDFNETVDVYADITLNCVNDDNSKEVAQMLVDFSKEEWNGKNTKEYEDCLEQVFHRNIAVFVQHNNVIGYGEVIGNSDMIGTIFIKNEYRNKGYGRLLTSLISQELLNHNEKLRVMTTNKNTAMKIILEKLGFKEYCKHLEIWKK